LLRNNGQLQLVPASCCCCCCVVCVVQLFAFAASTPESPRGQTRAMGHANTPKAKPEVPNCYEIVRTNIFFTEDINAPSEVGETQSSRLLDYIIHGSTVRATKKQSIPVIICCWLHTYHALARNYETQALRKAERNCSVHSTVLYYTNGQFFRKFSVFNI